MAQTNHELVTEDMITTALMARVPGGAEVWCWLPALDAWTPHQTARDVMRAALVAVLADYPAPAVKALKRLVRLSNSTRIVEHDRAWAEAEAVVKRLKADGPKGQDGQLRDESSSDSLEQANGG